MSTSAFQGQGCKLQYLSTVSPPSYTAITQLRTINFAGNKTGTDDVTNMDSVGAYTEKVPTFIDAGELNFTGVIPVDASTGGFGTLRTLQDARGTHVWQVLEPALTLVSPQTEVGFWEFEGFVSATPFDLDYSKAGTFSGSITITGPISYTPAA